jgi:mRNA-degrading endonuclease RelE of RelBE toxin-antitoxin system
MQSRAKTATEYLKSLPADRKQIISDLRNVILKNLPKGFEETMQYGMISYVVPHSLYKQGYHVKPSDALPFISLASQKNHIAVYHMAVYEGELHDWFIKEWEKASDKKLDMGKSCIRFKKAEDVPVKLMGALASKLTPKQWIAMYEENVLSRTTKK